MINQIGFFFSLSLILFVVDCSNASSIESCKRSCRDKQSLCFITTSASNSQASSNLLTCEIYVSNCNSSCSKSSSNSKSSSRSSGSSRSRGSSSSSSSGSKNSGSGGGSGGGGSGSSGSGGSSHTITADTGN